MFVIHKLHVTAGARAAPLQVPNGCRASYAFNLYACCLHQPTQYRQRHGRLERHSDNVWPLYSDCSKVLLRQVRHLYYCLTGNADIQSVRL